MVVYLARASIQKSWSLKLEKVVKEGLEGFQRLFVLDYNCSRIETLMHLKNCTKIHGRWYH